ncbi:MAG: beta-ketoacyl-[acyl-carrier-protein] synthase family protein [Desulfobacter sp.]
MKRVVVTGLGVTSPFGFGVDTFWKSLVAGENGIRKIDGIDPKGKVMGVHAPLPTIEYTKERFPELRGQVPEKNEDLAFFAAVQEAVEESGLDFFTYGSTDRVGVSVSNILALDKTHLEDTEPLKKYAVNPDTEDVDLRKVLALCHERELCKSDPDIEHDHVGHMTNKAYNITGPHMVTSTACASANNAIGEAFYKIRSSRLDVVLAGGAFNHNYNGLFGFSRLGALTMNPDPETACSPFDKRRSGFVMGSGCGVLVMESLEHALQRGAQILAEVVGYASYGDAYRATDPDPEGKGARYTMEAAIEVARLHPDQISYINGHGTSTKMNDLIETKVIKEIFKDRAYDIPVNSTKSMVGHSVSACGALEGVACIKSICDGIVHPTRNWAEQDTDMDLDYVPGAAREVDVKYALSNNFGFGGQNATVIFGKYE